MIRQAIEPPHPEEIDTQHDSLIDRGMRKLPPHLFLWLAGASIGGSLMLRLLRRRHDALFLGHWAPTLVALEIYRRLDRR